MKYVALAVFCLILIVPACGHAGADYETKHGFDVWLNGQSGPDEDDLEAAVDYALAIIVAKGIYTQEQVDRAMKREGDHTIVQVREIISDMGFWCGRDSPTNYCWGRFWHTDMVIEITNQECIATTAMVHEMLHWAHWAIEGISDIAHEDTRMFVSACRNVPKDEQNECMKNTAERAANVALCLDVCGSCLMED
jgi:hypothetical protein